MASHSKPGGGVKNGAIAQEEDLFRKSNYFEATDEKLYPLGMTEAIYSPIVHIIKDNNHKLLENPVKVSCLAVAALDHPFLTKDKIPNYASKLDYEIMCQKIEMMFQIAILNGHHTLVLGAFGCGAYRNPPSVVAAIFKLYVEKYKYFFKTIGFAVLCGSNNTNFEIFRVF